MLRHFIACLILTLGPSASGEDPVILGFKKAAAQFQPVPQESARKAIDAANSHLSPYLKRQGSNYACSPLAGSRKWVELHGLRFSGTHFDALSGADQANGIEQRLRVRVAVDSYRYLEADGTWGQWTNGRPFTMPAAVVVEKGRAGWRASSSISSFLRPVNDQRLSIPAALASAPQAVLPRQSTRPASPSPTRPKSSPTPTPAAPAGAPTKQMGDQFFRALFPLFFIAVGGMAFAFFLSRVRRPRNRSRATPPPWSKKSPPPLPPSSHQASSDSLELFTRRETLMTDAEQKFFAVLQPLVAPSYHISSKVRLADIFDVLYAPGRKAAFNKIRSKHIDFVLTEPGTSRILCGIELDDNSHQRPDRVERDRFVNQLFASQSVPLLRVPWAHHYDPEALRQSIARILGRTLAA